jgi:hypothetical protein
MYSDGNWQQISSVGTLAGAIMTRVIGSNGVDIKSYDVSRDKDYIIGVKDGDTLIRELKGKTKTSGGHNHDVIDAKGDLKGRTVGVKSYTKTATPINMRSAYLVTNFIIKY